MTDGSTALANDRLPWLSDEPKRRLRGGSRQLLGWMTAALLLIAAIAYWLGSTPAERVYVPDLQTPAVKPSTTVALPQPRNMESSAAQIASEVMPQVEPIAPTRMPVANQAPNQSKRLSPTMSSAGGTDVPAADDSSAPGNQTDVLAEAEPEPAPAPAKLDPLVLWPVRVIPGASGRLVRVGTFKTTHQAKKGWWAIVGMNPSLKRLQALVVPAQSLRDGKTYYRLQMGTTSQAHSEVLCQRMRTIGQSCVVVAVNDRGVSTD
jgi:hypothetical protein